MRQGGSPRSHDRTDSAIRAALVIAAFAPFAATLFFGYVYDDKAIVLHNSQLDGWKSLVRVWSSPYWSTGGADQFGLYRPLLMAMFAVIWNGAHKFAIAFHFVIVVLHVVATLLLARLLRRAVGRWPAAIGALWFAIHPVHVEAVANISNSSEILVAIWTLLLALLLVNGAPPRGWRVIIAGVLYAGALLSKESGVVTPALALLVAWGWNTPPRAATPAPRMLFGAWRATLTAWALVLAAVVAARSAVLGGVIGTVSIAAPGIEGLSPGQRIWAMLSLGGRVARLLVWPTTLNPHYGPSVFPSGAAASIAALSTILVMLAALGASWWLARNSANRDARPLVGLCWAVVAFLPASNLLTATGQILAERTLYVPSIGVALVVAWIVDRALADAAAPATPAAASRTRFVAALVALFFVVTCVRGFLMTRRYAAEWRNEATLFTHMIRADSLSYRGYQMLANVNESQGHHAESVRLYARAYALRPSDPTLLTDYGEYLLETRRPRYALAIGERLFRHTDMWTDPRAVDVLLNATARVWGADSVLASARRLQTVAPSARASLFIGLAYEARGDSTAALAAYREGLRLAPRDSALTVRAAALSHPSR
jgi:tetratricopeptide (TPR) repeat protein